MTCDSTPRDSSTRVALGQRLDLRADLAKRGRLPEDRDIHAGNRDAAPARRPYRQFHLRQ